VIDLNTIAGWGAVVAAVATVVGAVLLGLFFAKGQPWGTLNDIASIVLMAATIPVASELSDLIGGGPFVLWIGILGMLGAILAQGALVLRLATYRRLLPYTLGAGALVGVWYVLVALGGTPVLGLPRAVLAGLSGAGYIAIAIAFVRGNERDPVGIAGGLGLVGASTAFLGWLGVDLLRGVVGVNLTGG